MGGRKGNDGVTALIKSTPNSIGYIELAYALNQKLSQANLMIKGKKVKPDMTAIQSGAASVAKSMNLDNDLVASLIDLSGEGYPLASFTYLMLPVERMDKQTKKAVKTYLDWALTKGQEMSSSLHYAPLPNELVKLINKQLAENI